MTKRERELREYKSLFCDERYAQKAWRSIIGHSLEGDAKPLPPTIDPKTGELTFQSALDQMAYSNVEARLKEQGLDRKPMQAELIIECNILRARFDNSTFNTVLERTAGKVKDELIVNKSAFEDLTDEQLEALAALEESKKQKENK